MSAKSPILDDLAGLMTGAMGAARAAGEEMKTAGESRVRAMITDMDLASREEVEALKAIAVQALERVEALEKRLEHIKTPMSLSIIGCVVNGPGEALMTDVGFTGGGNGAGMVYLAGKQSHKMSNDQMVDHIVEQVEKKAAELEAANAEEVAAE